MGYRDAAKTALVLILAVLLAACGGEEPAADSSTTAGAETSSLSGRWERADSSFTSLDGMIIEVGADETEALIVTVPENEYMFETGDVKWRSIEPTGTNEYSFEDLVRESGTGATSYVEGVITVTGDDTLEMTFPSTGTTQEWVRATG